MRLFTLAILMARVPALRPWELTEGAQFDVLAGLPVLLATIRCGVVIAMHLGTPCQSFTQARVPALRSRKFPLGLPDLTDKQQEQVRSGNDLSDASASLCCALYEAGGYFSLENPERSMIWLVPQLLELFSRAGVAAVLVFYNAYGTLFVKPTLLLHNMPTLHALHRPQPLRSRPMIELRGWVSFKGVKTARTLLAQPYPPQLAMAYGDLVAESVTLRSEAILESRTVPFASEEASHGHPLCGVSLQHPVLQASAGSGFVC